MKETIQWSMNGPLVRKAVVELCGWRNSKGNATPTGLRIAKTDWESLSDCARNVLVNHGIQR